MGTIPAGRLGLRVRLGIRQPDTDALVLGIARDRLRVGTDADLRVPQTLHVSLPEGTHAHLARGAVQQVTRPAPAGVPWACEAEIVLFSMPPPLAAWLAERSRQADRRAHERLPDRARVSLSGAWARSSAWTVDVSAVGLRVSGAARPEVGSRLHLLVYAIADQDPTRLNGVVAHQGAEPGVDTQGEPGFGLAIGELDPRDRSAWDLYLERLAAFARPDPEAFP